MREQSLDPYPEQTAIVRFLDHADRRIRRYIRAKSEADCATGGAEAATSSTKLSLARSCPHQPALPGLQVRCGVVGRCAGALGGEIPGCLHQQSYLCRIPLPGTKRLKPNRISGWTHGFTTWAGIFPAYGETNYEPHQLLTNSTIFRTASFRFLA